MRLSDISGDCFRSGLHSALVHDRVLVPTDRCGGLPPTDRSRPSQSSALYFALYVLPKETGMLYPPRALPMEVLVPGFRTKLLASAMTALEYLSAVCLVEVLLWLDVAGATPDRASPAHSHPTVQPWGFTARAGM